jgi:hypothetical protein
MMSPKGSAFGDAILNARSAEVVAYEQRLNENPRWALNEGSRHFDEKSDVYLALTEICRRLNELGISYAVVGGMALFKHGFRRFTEDVDILVTREDLKTVHEKLTGLGYRPLFTGSKNLRDVDRGVRIEFLLTGEYPGDGKEKPVSFPMPQDVSFEEEGISYLQLPALVELKLASGMTGADRIKDLADVQELIKLLSLPEDFCEQLASYVQVKYQELWRSIHFTKRRYLQLWRNKFLSLDAQSIDDMILQLDDAAKTLKRMRDDGVTLDPAGGTSDDYAHLITTDPNIAKKYDMHVETEFWGSEDGLNEGEMQSEE